MIFPQFQDRTERLRQKLYMSLELTMGKHMHKHRLLWHTGRPSRVDLTNKDLSVGDETVGWN